MDLLLSLVEKLLFMLVSYFLLIFVSFSFFTGKFPPQKDDFARAISLVKQMVVNKQEVQAAGQEIQGNATPSLDQVLNYQKLAMKQTEVTIELTKLFPKLQGLGGSGNAELAVKIQKVHQNLTESEKLLGEIGNGLKQGFSQ